MAPLKPRGKVEAEQASDYEFYSIATDLLRAPKGTIRKKNPSDHEMRATAGRKWVERATAASGALRATHVSNGHAAKPPLSARVTAAASLVPSVAASAPPSDAPCLPNCESMLNTSSSPDVE